MKFVLASYGSRGDVEPCAAVGRELFGVWACSLPDAAMPGSIVA